ncbi:MAG: type II secretion system GspH family protein [Planctomycetales bacterium]
MLAYPRPLSTREVSPRRRGVTLIELMVVLAIMAIVFALLLSTWRPSLDDVRLREASRGATAFIMGAKDRALDSGRAFGVRIESYQDAENPTLARSNAAYRLSYIEQPAPYAGDYFNSKAVVRYVPIDPNDPNSPRVNKILALGYVDPDPMVGFTPDQMYKTYKINLVGSSIRLGYQGHEYVIITADDTLDMNGGFTNPWILQSATRQGTRIDPPTGPGAPPTVYPGVTVDQPYNTRNSGVGYQIYLPPMKSGTKAFDLPKGIAIDLDASGMSGTEFAALSAGDVRRVDFLFAPKGSVAALILSTDGVIDGGVIPTQSFHFLIGKNEQVLEPGDTAPPPVIGSDDVDANWRDPETLWVSVNPITGKVRSSPNDALSITAPDTDKPGQIIEARFFARTAQGVGGQ